MRKLAVRWLVILAVLLIPYAGLLGQVIPNGGGPRGFSGVSALYLNGQTSAGSGVPKIDSATLSNPNVDGISVAVYWRDFYINQNDPKSPIDWTGLDSVFAQAAAAGKYVRLIIPPGFYSPAWVLQSVPVLKLPVAEGPLADGALHSLPVPWDNTYLGYWLAFVDQLAVRYGNNPNLSWISVTGPNAHNGEVNLPHYDPNKGQPSEKAVWLQTAADAGINGEANQLQWLLQQLEQAYFKCIDRFDAAFGSRGRRYTIALIGNSFPIENEPQLQTAYKQDLVAYGAAHYPKSFGVQNNGLNGDPLCTGNPGPDPVWAFIGTYSSTLFTGFQTQAPSNLYCTGSPDAQVLHQTVNNAVQYQARFIEIYSKDVLDTALAIEIAYAHQKLAVPAIALVANAEGEAPAIAPNTWVEIKGTTLAPASDSRIWQESDFTNGKMPTQLDGVSVTVNGKAAFVYYISPAQVNVLTPPDAMAGQVQVLVTNNGATNASFTAQAQALSPSFFVFGGGPYVAAVHASGDLIGPVSLYPGSTTPAKPGEVVMLYANGFGPTSTPLVSGSLFQSGSLSPQPAIKIGGITAAVQFAGLVKPGEFQFNVVVPELLADGDQPITATYNGLGTQAGTLITVRH